MPKGLNILVSGATGFIGRALVRRLLAGGHKVTALVRRGSSVPEGAVAVVHELGAGVALKLPAGIDAVAHLAQTRAYRAFPNNAEEMFRVNVAGTHELLAGAAGARVPRFCLVSSGTVYEPFRGRLVEDAALFPTGPLGATKLAAEAIARPYAALFPVSILRLFCPYGPGQTDRLIPDLIHRVCAGEAVTLPASGGGMRVSPTYVDDICEAMLTAIVETWSGVFNLAAPVALSIEDAARAIGQAMGRPIVLQRRSGPSCAGGEAPAVVPDLTKLGRRYDLSRFRSFSAGIAATIEGECRAAHGP
jgi:nucleoside-diphosphate-sugar epimerase